MLPLGLLPHRLSCPFPGIIYLVPYQILSKWSPLADMIWRIINVADSTLDNIQQLKAVSFVPWLSDYLPLGCRQETDCLPRGFLTVFWVWTLLKTDHVLQTYSPDTETLTSSVAYCNNEEIAHELLEAQAPGAWLLRIDCVLRPSICLPFPLHALSD